MNKRKESLNDKRVVIIKRLLAAGGTVDNIASKLEIEPSYLRAICKRYSITIPRPRYSKDKSINDERMIRVRKLINDGATRDEIINDLKVHPSYLSTICKQYGVKLPEIERRKPPESSRTYEDEQALKSAIDLLKNYGFKIIPPDPFKGEMLKG